MVDVVQHKMSEIEISGLGNVLHPILLTMEKESVQNVFDEEEEVGSADYQHSFQRIVVP